MINQRETAEKAEIARLDGIKRKGVVFHHDVNFFYATLFGGRKNKHTMMGLSFSVKAWVRSPRVHAQLQ